MPRSSFAQSLAAHAAAALLLWAWVALRPSAPIVADLDLSLSSFVQRPANAGGGLSKPALVWREAPKDAVAASPAVEPAPSANEDEPAAPCVAPCKDNGTGGGGTGEGTGRYVPASDTLRKPRWTDNLITADDYPRVARENGKDGRVVLSVLIDETGAVKDARLLQGGYPALNEVALAKVRQARFTPAIGKDGRPVPCEVTLPIRFELR